MHSFFGDCATHYLKDKELLERVQHRFTRMFKDLRQGVMMKDIEEFKLVDFRGEAK